MGNNWWAQGGVQIAGFDKCDWICENRPYWHNN